MLLALTPFMVEAFLRVFLGNPVPQVWPPNVSVTREIRDLVDPAAKKKYLFRTNGLGLRGDEPPPGGEVALFLGNSTTECEGISNAETWPELAVRAMGPAAGRLACANAARSGMLLRHNVLQAERTLADLKAAGFRVTDVVLMPGAIDVQRFLASPEPLPAFAPADPAQRALLEQQAFPGLSFFYPEDPWYKRNLTVLYLRRVKTQLFPDKGGGGNELDHHKRRELRQAAAKEPLPETKAARFDAFLAEFGSELRVLQERVAAQGARLTLVSQPICAHPADWRLWNSGALDAGLDAKEILKGKAPYLAEPDYIALVARLDSAVARSADSALGTRFIPLADSLPVEPGLFYDTFHFTEAGCARAGRIVGEGLKAP